jgi:N-acetylglucosamine repressor
MRDLNTSLVVNFVKSEGPISRADLARLSHLTPATVSSIVAPLLRQGILSEVAIGPSSGGRPPVLLHLNPKAGYVIGIKLRENGLTTVLTDLDTEVIYSAESNERLSGRPEATLDAIKNAVSMAIADSKVRRNKVVGVGIGLAGVIDSERGVCRYSHLLGWRDVPLRDPLRRALRLPVWIDNDVNTLAVAEKWFGAGQHHRHFLTVSLGRGVGLGIVVDRKIYRGADGGAGEFGHIVVDPKGPLCQCGRRGCLEALVGETALEARATALIGRKVAWAELVRLAAAGEPAVVQTLNEAGSQLGRGLVNLVALFNPELVILSGEGVQLGAPLVEPIEQALRRGTFADLGKDLEVVVQKWGDEAWAIGAATLVLRELFGMPTEQEEHVSIGRRLSGSAPLATAASAGG